MNVLGFPATGTKYHCKDSVSGLSKRNFNFAHDEIRGFINGGQLDPTTAVWYIPPVAVFIGVVDFHAILSCVSRVGLERHGVSGRTMKGVLLQPSKFEGLITDSPQIRLRLSGV